MDAPETDALARSGRWLRASGRLARYSWPVLLVAVTVALVGGAVSAATWQPYVDDARAEATKCEDPPCFGGGGLPGVRDLPVVVSNLGYALAIILGVPSLLVGGWDLLRGRWGVGGRRMLAFVGPVLVLVGTEVVPHLLSPCLPALLGADWVPSVCERTAEGVDVKDRWHPLDHALVGALPLAGIYWGALHRWRPDLARFRVA